MVKQFETDPALLEASLEARKRRREMSAEAGSDRAAKSANPEEWASTKSTVRKTSALLSEQGKARDEYLKSMGYSLKARPYEFDSGAFKSPYLAEQLAMLDRAKGETAGQVAGMAGPQDEFRQKQTYLTDLLTRASEGQGPSMVDPTHRKAIDQAIAAGRAGAVSSGLSPAMAARVGAETTGAAATEAANQAAQLKAQEMQQARTELAGVSQAARTGDLTLADNQQKYLQDMTQFYITQGLTVQQAQFQANMELEKQKAQQHAQAQQTLAAQPQKKGVLDSILGGVAAVGGSIATAVSGPKSDINLKENIKGGDKQVKSFLDNLLAKEYNYKEESPDNRRLGVMAQDMEKSEMGKEGVQEGSDGFKEISVMKTLPLLLASVAHLNKRLKKVEK